VTSERVATRNHVRNRASSRVSCEKKAIGRKPWRTLRTGKNPEPKSRLPPPVPRSSHALDAALTRRVITATVAPPRFAANVGIVHLLGAFYFRFPAAPDSCHDHRASTCRRPRPRGRWWPWRPRARTTGKSHPSCAACRGARWTHRVFARCAVRARTFPRASAVQQRLQPCVRGRCSDS